MSGQVLPPEVAETLLALREDVLSGDDAARTRAWQLLVGYCDLVERAGWQRKCMNEVLGVSHEAIRQWRLEYPPAYLPHWAVPHPPPRVSQSPKPSPWSPSLPDEIRDELRRLRLASEGVRGPGRVDDPAWQAGRDFAHLVAALVEQGYSVYRIATDLGVTHAAVKLRLARHGLCAFPPSQAPKRGSRELLVGAS